MDIALNKSNLILVWRLAYFKCLLAIDTMEFFKFALFIVDFLMNDFGTIKILIES